MAIVSIVNGLGNYVDAYSDVSLTHPSLNSIVDGELVGQTVANRQPNQLIMNDEALRDQMKALELRLHNDYYTKYDIKTSGRSEVHWNNLTNVPDFNHNTLTGLQGTGPEFYHLSDSEYNKLKSIPEVKPPSNNNVSYATLGNSTLFINNGAFTLNLKKGNYFIFVVGAGGGGGNGGSLPGSNGGNGDYVVDLITLDTDSTLIFNITLGVGGNSGYNEFMGGGSAYGYSEQPTAGGNTILNISGGIFRSYNASGGAAGTNGAHSSVSYGGSAASVASELDSIGGIPIISGYNGMLSSICPFGGQARHQGGNPIGGVGGISSGNTAGSYPWSVAYHGSTTPRGLGTGGRGGSGGAFYPSNPSNNTFPQGSGGGGGAQGVVVVTALPVI